MTPSTHRVLVYGIEATSIPFVPEKITTAKCELLFHPKHEAPPFQEFDGVIIFQRACETFGRVNSSYASFIKHGCDRDELDKRTKELRLLTAKGGFACAVLTSALIDKAEGNDYRNTDLAKRLFLRIDRADFPERMPHVESKVDELRPFFDQFGAAWSYFSPRYGHESCKVLALVNRNAVSIVIDDCIFAIPTLTPSPKAVNKYFTTLADGVVALRARLKIDLPGWAGSYRFAEESKLLEAQQELSNRISEIDERLKLFERLKRVLVLQGEPLVDAVVEVFDKAMPLKAVREDAFREDIKLNDSGGALVAFAEVKGVSRGVAREHVNQADSHRERNGMPPTFPSLLIINTNAKNAQSLDEKDQAPAAEQVRHAAKMNVLIVRTLDLLNLASLVMSSRIDAETVVNLLTTSVGWLKVSENQADVVGS